ncbi:MAG TPA: flagellar protein FlaG [Bryobacteraceae bacterium]|nr:flagellar protein FlaG [Bryobacteraceae bacterium]
MDISSVDLQRPLTAIAAPQPIPQDQAAERRQLIQAVREVNKSEMLGDNNEVTFVMDRKSRKALVRVVNRQTNEVVMQIPPEYLLRMAEDLRHNS